MDDDDLGMRIVDRQMRKGQAKVTGEESGRGGRGAAAGEATPGEATSLTGSSSSGDDSCVEDLNLNYKINVP